MENPKVDERLLPLSCFCCGEFMCTCRLITTDGDSLMCITHNKEI